MLRLKLHDETQTEVIYHYFPENEKDGGLLAVNKETGDIRTISVPENDEFNIYLHHAVSRLDKYFANKNYLEKDVVAWY